MAAVSNRTHRHLFAPTVVLPGGEKKKKRKEEEATQKTRGCTGVALISLVVNKMWLHPPKLKTHDPSPACPNTFLTGTHKIKSCWVSNRDNETGFLFYNLGNNHQYLHLSWCKCSKIQPYLSHVSLFHCLKAQKQKTIKTRKQEGHFSKINQSKP